MSYRLQQSLSERPCVTRNLPSQRSVDTPPFSFSTTTYRYDETDCDFVDRRRRVTAHLEGVRYYGYRYYNPDLGRWISRDPIGESGGVSLYLHTFNAPITGIDKYGLKVDVRPVQPMPRYVDTYDEFRAFISSWDENKRYPDDGISPWGQYFEIEKTHQQHTWWKGQCKEGLKELMPQGVPILEYAIAIFNAHKDELDSQGNSVLEHESFHRDHHIESLEKYESKVWGYAGKCYCPPCPSLIDAYLSEYRKLVDIYATLMDFTLDNSNQLIIRYTAKYQQQKLKVESSLTEIKNNECE